MKLLRTGLAAGLCALLLTCPTLSKEHAKTPEILPLLYAKRSFVTNSSWSNDHARMGGSEISAYIMGHGGEADATMRFILEGRNENKFEMFQATVGYLDTAPDGRGATFEVWVNGSKVASKGPLISGDPPQTFRVNIKGATDLLLRVVPDRYNDTLGATWGDPILSTVFEEESENPMLTITGENHSYREEPNSFKGSQEINFPVPLYPGTNEFLLHTEYDKDKGTVKYTLTHEGSHPEVGATIVRRKQEANR